MLVEGASWGDRAGVQRKVRELLSTSLKYSGSGRQGDTGQQQANAAKGYRRSVMAALRRVGQNMVQSKVTSEKRPVRPTTCE